MFIQKLFKDGNSIGVTIPKSFLEALNLKEGSEVIVEKRRDEIYIFSKTKKYSVNTNRKIYENDR